MKLVIVMRYIDRPHGSAPLLTRSVGWPVIRRSDIRLNWLRPNFVQRVGGAVKKYLKTRMALALAI